MNRIIFFVFLMLINTSAIFSQTDILENFNGDFEDGITHWRFFEVPNNIGSSWEITSDIFTGNHAVRIDYIETDGTIQDRGIDNWSAGVPVVGGTEYIFKAEVKGINSVEMKVNYLIGFFDSSGNVLSPQTAQYFTLESVFVSHEITVTAPQNAASCWVAFRMYDMNGYRAAGNMYLDNVQLIGESIGSITPRVMNTTLPSDDVPIASINVTEEPYNAKNDGSTDATSAFQEAMDRAALAGGAVVYVPTGSYRFDGNLTIPEKVILRGDWENPEKGHGARGTILKPYANKGVAGGVPFIKIYRGAGIKNLSIFYPEQSASSVSAYPWTIHCNPDGSAAAGNNTSVINVNLVNSYDGIKIGPNVNELHYIRNVYGTPLNQGIWLSQTTDIGRIMNVHFEPKYWSESGLAGSPSDETILSWTKNNATGIIMGRSDWEYIYDVSLIGFHTGIQIIKYSDLGPNGVIYGLNIEKSIIGIDLVDVNYIGFAISNSSIKVEGTNSSCVQAHDGFSSVVQFNTCTFESIMGKVVDFSSHSSGRLSFQNCTFDDWGQTEDNPAIDCIQGSVSLMGNIFKQDKLHIRLGQYVKNTQILDNSFPDKLKIDNQSTGEVIISQEPLDLSKQNINTYQFAIEPKPSKDELFNVIDYGAVASTNTDNTAAFQSALDAAGSNGGGTVYIPAGMYRISSHLEVPTGVELRGIWDVPHHTVSKGSVLLAYEGKNDADGIPFISLKSGAGARGFTVWYPEQNTNDFPAYPWSIQTQGQNCWVKDVTLGNTYQGLDLATYTSTGHIVSYLAGAPLKTGLSVDKNSGDGWIENVQFNPHYWRRSSGYPQDEIPNINVIIAKQQSQLDAFKIASATHEHILGTFVFAANKGMYLASDGGNSNIDIFLHGTDAGSNAVFLNSKTGSKINFVNTQLVLLGSNQNGIITSSSDFSGNVSFYNSLSWGGSGATTNLSGTGKFLIQQIHSRNGVFKLNGGDTRLENVVITSTISPQFHIGSEIEQLKLFGSYANNGFKAFNLNEDRSIVELDYYYNNNIKVEGLETGWEDNETQNSWDNTLFGNKDFPNSSLFRCEPRVVTNAHSGSIVLNVRGNKINNKTPSYKIFNSKILITESTTLSYWLNPKNENGKTGHIDILFTDGTRLTEYSKTANDGLLLDSPRGTISEWIQIEFPIGNYVEGKSIQSVLVGAKQELNEEFDFLVDDLKIGDFVLRIENQILDRSISYYPNPASDFITVQSELPLKKIEIYSILGKKVKVVKNKFDSISLKNLSKGSLYILKIYSDKGVAVKKVIIN